LISGFADYVLQRELGSQRYTDPDVPSREHPADVCRKSWMACAR
jgi:50S ribosomal protein L16 3-hydroxylase